MRALRRWAWPLVPLYWAGLRLKDGVRSAGLLKAHRLGRPVVSVGSLSAGGAGKTPVVIALAELLGRNGRAVDVLSRGYGRAGSGVERVDPALGDAASRFGDEPVLIALRSGVPVWVGRERFEAGRVAEGVAGVGRVIHLLDDGFQHRQLGRSFDAVLLTAEDLQQALLPAGNLREPLSALRRADALVVREEEAGDVVRRAQRWMRPERPVWVVRRRLEIPGRLRDGPGVAAFCGIARPEGFFGMLEQRGVRLTARVAFADHHRYTKGDVSRVVESCHLESCEFVTTEKDAVKLGPELRKMLERAGGLHVARLEASFVDPQGVLRALEARLA